MLAGGCWSTLQSGSSWSRATPPAVRQPQPRPCPTTAAAEASACVCCAAAPPSGLLVPRMGLIPKLMLFHGACTKDDPFVQMSAQRNRTMNLGTLIWLYHGGEL